MKNKYWIIFLATRDFVAACILNLAFYMSGVAGIVTIYMLASVVDKLDGLKKKLTSKTALVI